MNPFVRDTASWNLHPSTNPPFPPPPPPPPSLKKARTPSLGRHPDQAKGLFAGPNTSPGDETVGSGDMPPQNAGSSDNLGDDAAAQLLSAPSVAGDGAVVLGDVDGGVGDEREVVSAAGAVAEPEPALINVAKGKQGVAAATLWNVPNMLTMARVVAIPVRRFCGRHGRLHE